MKFSKESACDCAQNGKPRVEQPGPQKLSEVLRLHKLQLWKVLPTYRWWHHWCLSVSESSQLCTVTGQGTGSTAFGHEEVSEIPRDFHVNYVSILPQPRKHWLDNWGGEERWLFSHTFINLQYHSSAAFIAALEFWVVWCVWLLLLALPSLVA